MTEADLTGDTTPAACDGLDAAKPLSAFRQIIFLCHDCGHARTFDEPALADLSSVPTFGMLAKRAFCAVCREAGGEGRGNIDFRTSLKHEAKASHADWSKAKVFTDDRSDPTPGLPRRSIFNRHIPDLERIRR